MGAPLVASAFTAAKILAGYVGGLAGASYVLDGASKVMQKTPVAPVLAGPIVDGAFALADPFDWTGHQKRRGKRPLVGFGDPASKLNRAIAAVETEARKAEDKAKEFYEREKTAASEQAKRWAATARETARLARAEENETRALEIAEAALDLARLGQNPPSTALDVLPSESTDEGRALMTTAVDTVRRMTIPFDASELAKKLVNPGDYIENAVTRPLVYAEGEEPMIPAMAGAPTLAGSCCASCFYGTGSCGGKDKGEVPEEFVSGLAYGSNREGDNSYEFTAYMNADAVAENDGEQANFFELSGASLTEHNDGPAQFDAMWGLYEALEASEE